MTHSPAVRSSAVINDGCPITYRVNCAGDVTFSVGPLQLTFQPEVLAELLRQGTEALDEVAARHAAIRAEAV
jgi:hypothetical protein